MSFFKKKRSLIISDHEPIYKVRYLGNVQTAMMKGEGCVDKPVGIIWNNYLRNSNPGLEMKLTLTTSGLKAETKEQGLTEYRAHRISYCIAHPQYPKLFIWVYRHEGKKMKLELRCHAVLCKSEAKAKAMAVQLHDKISFALKEFMREKTRKQNSRLTLQRTRSLPMKNSVIPLRTQMLSTGQNFKPPISKSNTAPRLGAITEDHEQEELESDDGILEEEEEDVNTCNGKVAFEEEEVEYEDEEDVNDLTSPTVDALTLCGHDKSSVEFSLDMDSERVIDIELGNNIDELKLDEEVQFIISRSADSDDESSESSGFNEADSKDGSLTATDDNSLNEEDVVCEVPTPHIPDETVVTSL